MMPTVEVEYNTDTQNAHRFPVWMALCVFSVISLIAACTTINKDDRGTAEKWVISVTAISLGFSFIAVLLYLFMRGVFVGQVFESGIVCHNIIMCIFEAFILCRLIHSFIFIRDRRPC